MFYRNGLQVLAVDYRGYGWSTGAPSEQGVYEDAVATVEYFETNFKKFRVPVVYWGRSLGGCIASFASKQLPPNGLILETTFPSKASLIGRVPATPPIQPFCALPAGNGPLSRRPSIPGSDPARRQGPHRASPAGPDPIQSVSGPKEFWTVPGSRTHRHSHGRQSALHAEGGRVRDQRSTPACALTPVNSGQSRVESSLTTWGSTSVASPSMRRSANRS